MKRTGMSRRGFLLASTAAAAGLAASACAASTEEPSLQEVNKALVRRYIEEVWNQGNVDLTDEIIAPDFVAGTMRGRRDHKEWVDYTHALMPDIHESIETIFADGDMVANRCLCTGTPEAEWLGLAPTGDKVEWRIHVFNRIVDGMIAEMWIEWSQLAVVRQLGGWCVQAD